MSGLTVFETGYFFWLLFLRLRIIFHWEPVLLLAGLWDSLFRCEVQVSSYCAGTDVTLVYPLKYSFLFKWPFKLLSLFPATYHQQIYELKYCSRERSVPESSGATIPGNSSFRVLRNGWANHGCSGGGHPHRPLTAFYLTHHSLIIFSSVNIIFYDAY